MTRGNRRHYKVEKLKSKKIIDKMLAEGYTYDDIAAAIEEKGEQISTSALQRYNASFEYAAEKIKRVQEQAKVLIDALHENPNTDMAEVANQVMMSGLLERVAGADDEFEKLPLDKVGALIARLEHSAVGRERLKLTYDKMLTAASEKIKNQLKLELAELPELQMKLVEQVDKIMNEITEKR